MRDIALDWCEHFFESGHYGDEWDYVVAVHTDRDQTVKEVSASVGKTTREAVTMSYGRNKGILGAQSSTSRLEERPLLSETEARFMDPDDVIILASPQHPIKATRIKYYEDPKFMAMMEAQEGRPLPYAPPQRPEVAVRMEQKVEASGPRAAGSERERFEPKAAMSMQRSRPARKMKLEMPEAGAGGRVRLQSIRVSWTERNRSTRAIWKSSAKGRSLPLGDMISGQRYLSTIIDRIWLKKAQAHYRRKVARIGGYQPFAASDANGS